MIQIEINGQKVISPEKKTILQAALDKGIYIPHLCFYDGLTPPCFLQSREAVYQDGKRIQSDTLAEYPGCNLCLVQIEGKPGYERSCTTVIEDRMQIFTETPEVQEERRRQLSQLLENHPHTCLACELAMGCDRKICSMNTPETERCCWKFGNCELQEIINYVGMPAGVPYRSDRVLPREDNPVFSKDFHLCINCLRCLTVCKGVAGREALGFIYQDGKVQVGWTDTTPTKSRCKYCSACIDVCPTGALKEKKAKGQKSAERLKLRPPKRPPQKEKGALLDRESLNSVPEKEGVFILYGDKKGAPIQISGTENLKEALGEILINEPDLKIYYHIEEAPMFMMRERQLIQQHLKKFNELPVRNREIDDLF